MLFRVHSAAVLGIHSFPITVEVDVSTGQKLKLKTVGLPDPAVRESKERVTAALRNCGYSLPRHRITINLAPAAVKKEGSGFDLPMAVAILGASGLLEKQDLSRVLISGELALDGTLRSVKGSLSMALMAKTQGMRGLLVPEINAKEAAIVEGIHVYAARSLQQVVNILNSDEPWVPVEIDPVKLLDDRVYDVDFKDVRGQYQAKRALEVAVAGGHNIIMIGPPRSGKTMLARRLCTILPAISFEEAVETTRIHSVAGLPSDSNGLVGTRPFRAPHHTVSYAGLIGGGSTPRPGEVSLAHNGVLFLDELSEFQRHVLDVLRQPLEDGRVTVTRASMSLTFPARFMLAAAMNPCPCGYHGNSRHECLCTPPMIQRYMARVSSPLLDRIDLHIHVPALQYRELASSNPAEDSASIRERIVAARQRQSRRFASLHISCNAQMTSRTIRRHCKLDSDSERLLENACSHFGLSARAYDRILKVARTMADLEGADNIPACYVAEAIQYRCLDRARP